MKQTVRRLLTVALVCALLAGGVSTMALAGESSGITITTFEGYLQEIFALMPEMDREAIEIEFTWDKTAEGRRRMATDYKGNSLLACSFPKSDVMEYGWCGGPEDVEGSQLNDLYVGCMISLPENKTMLERAELFAAAQKAGADAEVEFTKDGAGYIRFPMENYMMYQLVTEEQDGEWHFWVHQDSALTIEELYAESRGELALAAPEEKRDISAMTGLDKALGMATKKRGVSMDSFEAYLEENTKRLCSAGDTPFESVSFLREKTLEGRMEASASLGACTIGAVTFPESETLECLWLIMPDDGMTDIAERYFAGYSFSAIDNTVYTERSKMMDGFFDEMEKTRHIDDDGDVLSSAQMEAYMVYILLLDDDTVIAFHIHEDSTMTYQEAKDLVKTKGVAPAAASAAEEPAREEVSASAAAEDIALSDFGTYFVEEVEAKVKGDIQKLNVVYEEEEGLSTAHIVTDEMALFAVAFTNDPAVSCAAICAFPEAGDDNQVTYVGAFIAATANANDPLMRQARVLEAMEQMGQSMEKDSEGDVYSMATVGPYRFYLYASLECGPVALCIHEESKTEFVFLKTLAQNLK